MPHWHRRRRIRIQPSLLYRPSLLWWFLPNQTPYSGDPLHASLENNTPLTNPQQLSSNPLIFQISPRIIGYRYHVPWSCVEHLFLCRRNKVGKRWLRRDSFLGGGGGAVPVLLIFLDAIGVLGND